MQRIAVIINPTAGRGAAGRRLPEIKNALSGLASAEVVFHETLRPGDGEMLAAHAIAEGATIVAAAGGDGTLHEVVNAILAPSVPPVKLGLIPFGTGNDFARGVGLRGPLSHVIAALTSGVAHKIDIGLIESPSLPKPKHFLTAAGMGFVADTAKTVNDGVKGLTGTAAYLYGAVATLRRFVPEYVKVIIDGKLVFEGESTLISVSNVATTGGGIRIAPGAEPDDAALDVCIVSKVSKSKILRVLPKAFPGHHVRDVDVSMHRGQTIDIDTMNACRLWIDGEVTGQTPAKFTLLPGAVTMMLPTDWCSNRSN